MPSRALIADVHGPADFIRQAITGRYSEIQCVHTFNDAVEALASRQYDLIISGMHFDECRMMELLWRVKELPQYADVPFLCVRALAAHPEITESVARSHEALGAVGFVEIEGLNGESRDRLISALDSLCVPAA
jgi:CheY-like chemotaxis protein